MKRSKLSRSQSRKSFTRSASRSHMKNFQSSSGSQYMMRGGIRL